MSKVSTSAGAGTAVDVHGTLPATIAALCTAAILAPVAYFQFGDIGAITISAFAAAILLSVWLTAWGASLLAQSYPLLSGLFASSGVRMVAPFVIALVVVIGGGRIAPVETVYYVIPLYLCMLAADVVVWVQEAQKIQPVATLDNVSAAVTSGEAV